MKQRKAWTQVLVAILLLTSVALVAATDVTREQIDRVTNNIVCTCGSSGCPPTHLVKHCTCDRAEEMTREVAAMLAAGKTDEEIYASYIEQFGEAVMAAPDTKGFNLVGWALPFVALLIGGGIVMVVYRNLRTTAQPAAPNPADVSISDEHRERLSRELAE